MMTKAATTDINIGQTAIVYLKIRIMYSCCQELKIVGS